MPISRIETNSIAPSQTLTTPIIATTMGVGGATPAASGSGITFPATQSASSDANTLDDYEEGTWTPTPVGGATGFTVDAANCKYVKVGKQVTCALNIYAFTGTSGAILQVGGLPFSSDSGCESTFALMMSNTTFGGYLTGYIINGSNQFRVYASTSGSGYVVKVGTDVGASSEIIATLTYIATA